VEHELVRFIVVGFFAQLVDGALGMAYGLTSTTFLLSLGLTPVIASASVHVAEVFTTGASGIAHLRMGNVDRTLLAKLVVPGVVGGILGAYVLTAVPSSTIKPVVAVYMLIMGSVIIWKAFANIQRAQVRTKLLPLGFAGGFLDALGGGGWGPIVTSTLLARGNHPRFTIGSVNATEFFVTASQAATFVAVLGLVHSEVIIGLILGGLLAAPVGARLCQKLPAKLLMVLVGGIIIALSLRTIYQAL
jgi:uncharacterized membrane protein YfcA